MRGAGARRLITRETEGTSLAAYDPRATLGEGPLDVESLDRILLVGAVVVLSAVVAVRFSVRLGLPSLLLYLLIGVALGESGLGIQFADASMAHALGFAALAVILAEGGLTTRWAAVRASMPLGVALATFGVAVSTVVVALFAHYALGMDWTLAVLLGAIFAPTDAAAVFSTLRRITLRPRLAGALEAESGLNDAPTVVLVTLVSTGVAAEAGPLRMAGIIVYQLTAGTLVGLVVAWLAVKLLQRAALPASGLYPIAVLAFAVLAYAVGSSAHASGFAAVYVAGLVLGNSDLPHRAATRSFSEGLAWLAQIGLFVMLGLLSSPTKLGAGVVPAIAAGLVLTFVARPLSVWLATLPFRMPLKEQAFLSWAGLRGAVPIVFATIPLSERVTGSTYLFSVVFVFVFIFTLVQAPPLPWLASRLSVTAPAEARDVDVEVSSLERLSADLLQVRVTERSRLHGVAVSELRLPEDVSLALVVREGHGFVPGPSSTLRHGDEILIVTPRRFRQETEQRLRAVSRRGRLAGWFGERGDLVRDALPRRISRRRPHRKD